MYTATIPNLTLAVCMDALTHLPQSLNSIHARVPTVSHSGQWSSTVLKIFTFVKHIYNRQQENSAYYNDYFKR